MAYLPEIVYQHLPNLYIVAGVGIALTIEHPIGVISSLLLVAAGLFVFNFRIAHSKTLRTKQTRKQ